MWRLAHDRCITLEQPRLIGILNTTPDSFHADSRVAGVGEGVGRAREMVAGGAVMLDIGGESTRPGAEPVPAGIQIERCAGLIGAIRAAGDLADVAISIDTSSSVVAQAALEAGADCVNDVSEGRGDERMFAVVTGFGAGLILMHRLRPPEGDSYSDRYDREPAYASVVDEVSAFLGERMERAMEAGVAPEAIVLDPGLGFGKSVEQNLELIRQTPRLVGLGRPVLSALSRKSFVGRISLGRDSTPRERLSGTLGLSVAHAALGATLLRVHDVGEHARALRSAMAVGLLETTRGATRGAEAG